MVLDIWNLGINYVGDMGMTEFLIQLCIRLCFIMVALALTTAALFAWATVFYMCRG